MILELESGLGAKRLVETEKDEGRLGLSISAEEARRSAPADGWVRASSKRPSEEPGVALTVTRYSTPKECREQGTRKDRV